MIVKHIITQYNRMYALYCIIDISIQSLYVSTTLKYKYMDLQATVHISVRT